jgi:hypothetical protein
MNGHDMVYSTVVENKYEYRSRLIKTSETKIENMSNMQYNKTLRYINRNLTDITRYANLLLQTKELSQEITSYKTDSDGKSYEDFDYWNAYGSRVDLNFYGSEDGTQVLCTAYPVVDTVPNYDTAYGVRIALEVN